MFLPGDARGLMRWESEKSPVEEESGGYKESKEEDLN
jgi:hypothetical protein